MFWLAQFEAGVAEYGVYHHKKRLVAPFNQSIFERIFFALGIATYCKSGGGPGMLVNRGSKDRKTDVLYVID